MRNVRKLMRAYVQLPRQNLPVASGLIEHENEIGILQNILNFPGSKQILTILRNAGWDCAPLPEPLPNLHAPCGQLPFQQE